MEFAGAYYHVMARGNRRGAIFLDGDDRRFFLQCLSEVCEKTGWRVHGWVLMGKSLPSLYRDAGGEFGGGDEMAAKHGDAEV